MDSTEYFEKMATKIRNKTEDNITSIKNKMLGQASEYQLKWKVAVATSNVLFNSFVHPAELK